MNFTEFTEYSNPEESDYDIKSSLSESESYTAQSILDENQHVEQLIDLIGILEDVSDEEILETYGISVQEYYSPTAETIKKVSEKLNGSKGTKK